MDRAVELYRGYLIKAYRQAHKDYPSFVATISKEIKPKHIYMTNVEAGSLADVLYKAKTKINNLPDNMD